MESEQTNKLKIAMSNNSDVKKELGEVAKILVKCNLKNTLNTLVKESNSLMGKKDGDGAVIFELKGNTKGRVQYQFMDSIIVEKYCKGFSKLFNFINCAFDAYKQELSILLLPILSRIFLKFLKINKIEGRDIALQLCKQYRFDDGYFPGDTVSNLMEMTGIEDFKLNFPQVKLRMSMEVFKYFQTCFRTPGVISNIIAKELVLQIQIGGAKFNPILHANVVQRTNCKPMYFGLNLPTEENITSDNEECVQLKQKIEGGRPIQPSFPRALSVIHGTTNSEGACAMITLSRYTLPSVCCYTALNSYGTITCAEISEDGLMLAVGFSTSAVRVWSLTPRKLCNMKSSEELNALNIDLPDVLSFVMDETSGETSRYLYGHSGCVYRVNFSPDQNRLLSCSEDGTVRLWSLLTWKCLAVYKGHCSPVWDVSFSPNGCFFVSCSYDKTARLWSTDSLKTLRMFVGHISDVDCVIMHPNSNYVATGSTDCSVRIWDVSDGKCVRILLGHIIAIYVLAFSICGSYLASGSRDGVIKVWEMHRGLLIGNLKSHNGMIYSLCFSREGNLLAASGSDCRLNLWDFSQLIDDLLPDELGKTKQTKKDNKNEEKCDKEPPEYLLRSYPSKSTPFYSLVFTKSNLLLAMGPFLPPSP